MVNVQDLDRSKHYPIREFSKLTGVNPVTLRAWERRYGIIKPLRTDKGHRFYSDDHVERVNKILYWLDQGFPIRQVKMLLQDNVQPAEADMLDEWQPLQEEMIQQAVKLNAQRLDDIWSSGLANYPMAVYYDFCLLPVINHIQGKNEPSVVAKSFNYLLLKKLQQLVHTQQKHNKGERLLMVTTDPIGELQLLVAAYALGAAGFRVEYLGNNLNADEVALAAKSLNVDHLWVHFTPLDKKETSHWVDLLNNHEIDSQQANLFVSGGYPKLEYENKDIIFLPDSLSKQIKTAVANLDL